MARRLNKRGFSLLELVAVVALLGIVSAVVMLRLNTLDQGTAKANTNKHNVAALQAIVERYQFEKGSYPSSVDDLVTEGYLPLAPTPPGGEGSYAIDSGTGIVSHSTGS